MTPAAEVAASLVETQRRLDECRARCERLLLDSARLRMERDRVAVVAAGVADTLRRRVTLEPRDTVALVRSLEEILKEVGHG